MTVIEVKENGAIRTKMLSCDSPFLMQMSKNASRRRSAIGWKSSQDGRTMPT